MNKVKKIMLTAIIIMGTVGGVLAIKAKRVVKYCTANLPAFGASACPNIKCPNGTLREFESGIHNVCYKTTSSTANCASDDQKCTGSSGLVTN